MSASIDFWRLCLRCCAPSPSPRQPACTTGLSGPSEDTPISIPASGYTKPVIGKRVFIVDYNAVALARNSFLLSPHQEPPIFDRA